MTADKEFQSEDVRERAKEIVEASLEEDHSALEAHWPEVYRSIVGND